MMKKSLTFFLITILTGAFLLSSYSTKEESKVKWYSINQYDSLVKNGNKKILIDVYTDWCAPCRKMDAYTFNDKRIANFINRYYYPIKFNGESKDTLTFKENLQIPGKKTHQLIHTLNINAYPTLLFYDETGTLITKEAKFFSPNEMEIALHYIKDNHYKTSSYSSFKDNYNFE